MEKKKFRSKNNKVVEEKNKCCCNKDDSKLTEKKPSKNMLLNWKNQEKIKYADRRKGYIQKASIGDLKVYLHTGSRDGRVGEIL